MMMEEKHPHELRKLVHENTETPWCTIAMILGICICHTLVLVGNMQTATAIESIGVSTGGWSGVGVNLGASIENELGEVMKNITSMLSDAINHTMIVQKMLDTVLGLAGHIGHAHHTGNATKALFLLQAHGMMEAHGMLEAAHAQVPSGLPGMITHSVDDIMRKLMTTVENGLHTLMEKMKPVLLQVGKFIIKFGAKVDNILEDFSITLDRVQKIFDQVMSSLAHTGGDLAKMEYNTWHMFNLGGAGHVTPHDLRYTAKLYDVPSLEGAKSDELVKKYDTDNSGGLDMKEFKNFIHDPTIPNIMSVVLRSFSSTLAKIAGRMGGAKFRGEIAGDLNSYFDLMVEKNRTKVGWVSDALGNGSLPLPFVADIFVSMALALDNPNHHQRIPTGRVVITEMMKLHPKFTAKAVDLIGNVTYWVTEGYDPSDHAIVIKRVTGWVTEAEKANHLKKKQKDLYTLGNLSDLEEASDVVEASELIERGSWEDAPSMLMDKKVVDALPELAYKMAKENMRKYLAQREEEEQAHHDQLFDNPVSQMLLMELQDGQKAHHGKVSNPATRMMSKGVPALPQTLQFAKFLSWNASACAARFESYCFKYQKTSSNAVTSFASQVQGMVKKVKGFIHMMMRYSTPAGIEEIENTVNHFIDHAATDILKLVKKQVGGLMNKAAPMLNKAIHHALRSAADGLGRALVGIIASPLGQALMPALSGILAGLVGKESANDISKALTKVLSHDLTDAAGNAIGDPIYKLLKKLVNTALSSIGHAAEGALKKTSLLQVPTTNLLQSVDLSALGSADAAPAMLAGFEKDLGDAIRQCQTAVRDAVQQKLEQQGNSTDGIGALSLPDEADLLEEEDDHQNVTTSGAWNGLTQTLRSLTNLIPQATKALVFARKEVCELAKNLDSIFKEFHHSGPPVFSEVSTLWAIIWPLYYILVISFPLLLLWYAFWAGGYCGGAGRIYVEEPEPVTFYDKCCACYATCCGCICGCHDLTACFWGVLTLLQVIALLLFVIAIVFSILAGVKIFIASGCSQIYFLGDASICGNTLGGLRSFLDSFMPGFLVQEFAGMCDDKKLLTCKMIGTEMMLSGLMCVAGAFGAAMLTFQFLIEAATLHTRAVLRRQIANHIYEKEQAAGKED